MTITSTFYSSFTPLRKISFCMLLPGPEAQQLATYIGWLLHGVRGGIIAGAFFVLPSVFLLLALSYTYARFGNVPAVIGLLNGFKPVVVAIVVEALMKIGKRALKRRLHYAIAAAAFVSIYFFHIPFPVIVFLAAVIGLVMASDQAAEPTGDAAAAGNRKSHSAWKTLAVSVLLWVIPFTIIVLWSGWGSPFASLYRFFTQAAFVTFGGAYAVLAYVVQAAVNSYGWMTQAQAVDGLALAETTPGPLIMVLQFIGFMSGWNQAAGGTKQTASAILCALITTYTTFLPSFFFIFLCAPYIEKLRGNRRITAALTGVTAAVVGVILNLALVFGIAVIWKSGSLTDINWFAAVMSVAAFLALYRYKVDVLWVILSAGVIGFLWTMM